MNSAALIADGYHARTDGLTSLAVVVGVAGVWFGFPLADPIIGLLITVAIFGIVWQSGRAVLTRICWTASSPKSSMKSSMRQDMSRASSA
jgi:divalent metal cation (Fe/Co/Zn/Cd) transporter